MSVSRTTTHVSPKKELTADEKKFIAETAASFQGEGIRSVYNALHTFTWKSREALIKETKIPPSSMPSHLATLRKRGLAISRTAPRKKNAKPFSKAPLQWLKCSSRLIVPQDSVRHYDRAKSNGKAKPASEIDTLRAALSELVHAADRASVENEKVKEKAALVAMRAEALMEKQSGASSELARIKEIVAKL